MSCMLLSELIPLLARRYCAAARIKIDPLFSDNGTADWLLWYFDSYGVSKHVKQIVPGYFLHLVYQHLHCSGSLEQLFD